MMASRHDQPSFRQEAFLLDGLPSITHEYDLARARQAANNRKSRKNADPILGELALNKRTTTFMRLVDKLWIPNSGTESSAIIDSPESTIQLNSNRIRRAVIDKYEIDDSVSPARARQWGVRASSDIPQKFQGSITNYILDARFQFVDLCRVLDPEDLTYDADAIRDSDTATSGLKRYLITLRSFVGANRKDSSKRQWIQARWVNKVAESNEWAQQKIDSLPDRNLESVFDEAVYNSWSREEYWQDVRRRMDAHKREFSNQEPKYEQIPIEAYENDPENLQIY